MNTDDNQPIAENARIDALLTKHCVVPRQGVAEEILQAVLASGLDERIDARLSARMIRARATRTERILEEVRSVIRRGRTIRWSALAAVAVTVLAAVPVFLHEPQILPSEQIVSLAVARDPQLAALLSLDGESGSEFSGKEIAAGINDNSLIWLTILASNES